MRLFKGFIATVLGVFFFSSLLSAREERWTHFGLRPLGMGNAYVAVADDFNALFYNPAGLARLKEWDGEFLNFAPEMADHTYKTIFKEKSFQDMLSGKAKGVSSALDFFRGQTGKVHHAALYLTPHFVMQNFGFGFGTELFSLSLVPHSDINIELRAGAQVIAPISFARSFLEDRLSIGATVKFIARGGVDHSFTLESISAFSKSEDGKDEDGNTLEDFVQGGRGYGFDAGLLFTPIETMQPTLGISVTDIGGSVYQKMDVMGKALGVPKPRLPAVNTGVSIKPLHTSLTYLLLSADAHMINHPIHYSHKLNFGAEWGLSEILKLQTGLKSGYLTGGVQIDVGLLNLRFASYVVDHGPIVGQHPNLAQRRYAVQLKLLL